MTIETTTQDPAVTILETADGSQVAAVVDDEARLTVDDTLAITDMLESQANESKAEADPQQKARLPESGYGRTYWMENVGPRVGLGAAGVRGAEVRIDTGRQMPIRMAYKMGRMSLGTGRRQRQVSAR